MSYSKMTKAELREAIKTLKKEADKHKQIEKALRESEEKFRSLVENAPDIIMTLDREGIITFLNYTVPGISLEKVIGTNVREYTPPKHLDTVMNAIEKVFQTGEPASYEVSGMGPHGSTSYYATRISPIKYGNKVVAVILIATDITERKKSQEAVQESDERFRTVLDNVMDGILVADAQTHDFFLANKTMCDMLGYSQEEIRELDVRDIHPEDDLPRIVEVFQKQLAGEIRLALDIPVRRKDGSIFYADINSAPVMIGGREYVIGVFRDITERKQAERSIRESEIKYRTLLENLPQKIFMKDRNSVYIACNENYANDLGIKPEEIQGKTDYDFFSKGLAGKYRADDKRLMNSGKTEDFEERYIMGGREIWVHTMKIPIRGDNDDVVGILGIFWDITEQKEAAQEHLKFEAQKATVKKMKEIERMKSEFVSTVTHELRTPMTPLKSTIEMFLDGTLGELSEKQKKYMDMMSRNIERLAQFTTEVLTLSRLESGRYKLSPRTIDMYKTLEPVIEMMQSKARSKNSEIIFKVPEGISAYADGDSLGIVVTNLTNNAIVHTHEGTRITVSARNLNADRIELSIADNGEGIPEEAIENLFDRFYQAKRESGSGYHGTGVGLAVCKALVEEMGGEISVESKQGEGTAFKFTLPALPPEHQEKGK